MLVYLRVRRCIYLDLTKGLMCIELVNAVLRVLSTMMVIQWRDLTDNNSFEHHHVGIY